jgi:hypothetical protein
MTAIPHVTVRHLSIMLFAGLACCLLSAPALAALGGSPDTVDADAHALHGNVGTAPGAALAVRTISLPTGTLVKEYISPGGAVAAVSWRGPRPPNLSQLLGDYYADYQSALAARQPGQHNHHLHLDSGRMVLESAGHMRDLHGSAYLPALMPQDLAAGELN